MTTHTGLAQEGAAHCFLPQHHTQAWLRREQLTAFHCKKHTHRFGVGGNRENTEQAEREEM